MNNDPAILINRVQDFIKEENLFNSGSKLYCAVSGGIDSVVLCDVLFSLGYNFTILHCNFKLRGEESDRDENFVRNLAKKYNAEFYTRHFNTLEFAAENKISVQLAARELRYSWFEEYISADYLNLLLTAHHADDNTETLLMNLFRGTGLRGIRGILPKQKNICRPLLEITRSEIENYAGLKNLEWVEDSSNLSDKYTRNFFRRHIIPLVKEKIPAAEENILNTQEILRDTWLFYEYSIDNIKKKLLQDQGNSRCIPVLKLKSFPGYPALLWEIIQQYNFSFGQLKDVLHLLEAETGKYVQSSSHRIIRNRKFLLITGMKPENTDFFLAEDEHSKINLPEYEITFSIKTLHSSIDIARSTDTAVFPLDKIRFPIIIRKWRKGDYFYPFGMRKKKKLARFFIDIKLSAPEKESQYVLEMDKKIIWVAGRRTDDRFRITQFPAKVLIVKIVKNQ